MPGHIKVSGTWRSVSYPQVKVGGAWKQTVKAWVRVGGSWVVWFRFKITDAFTRSDTTTSLGNTDTGPAWTNVRGTWYVSSNQARSDTAASSYALASVPLGSADSTTSASVSNGVGPAFWITDSNNWWASHGHSVSTTTTGCGGGATAWSTSDPVVCACGSRETRVPCSGTPTAWSTTDPVTCACGSRQTQTVTSYTYYINDGGACLSGDTQVSCATGGASCSGICGTGGFVCCRQTITTTEYRCSQQPLATEYRCTDSQTTSTSITHFLRIISSVGGTVSTATGDVSLTSAAAAVKVVTSGNTITSYAYSDTAMNTQIGTSTVTPSSPTRGTSTGIVKAISSHQQGSTADNFSSEAG